MIEPCFRNFFGIRNKVVHRSTPVLGLLEKRLKSIKNRKNRFFQNESIFYRGTTRAKNLTRARAKRAQSDFVARAQLFQLFNKIFIFHNVSKSKICIKRMISSVKNNSNMNVIPCLLSETLVHVWNSAKGPPLNMRVGGTFAEFQR